MTLHEYVDAVVGYANALNASVTSWGRTTKHNATVGGVVGSAHRFWLGCDVVYDPPLWGEKDRVEWARRLGLKLIIEGDHDHLQPLDWSAG